MQVRVLITVSNLAISAILIYSKLLMGNFHLYYAKLYSIEGVDSALKGKLVSNTDSLGAGVTTLSVISLVIAVLLFKEKLNGKILGILNILLALACVINSLIIF